MKVRVLNTAFIITILVSLVIFIYLVFLGYDDIKTPKDVLKIMASIIFPMPMLLFVRCILISHFIPENSDLKKEKNKGPATVLLIVTLGVMLLCLQLLEWFTSRPLEDQLIFAHMINSTTISTYVLNFLLYNNLKANGVLSGILLSLAIHVFFISL